MVYDFKYEERKQLGRDTTYHLLYTRMLCHEQGGHNSTTGCRIRIPSHHHTSYNHHKDVTWTMSMNVAMTEIRYLIVYVVCADVSPEDQNNAVSTCLPMNVLHDPTSIHTCSY